MDKLSGIFIINLSLFFFNLFYQMGLWLSMLWLQTETTSHTHSLMAIINRCRFTYLVLLELDILLVVDDVATVVVATQGLLHFSV